MDLRFVTFSLGILLSAISLFMLIPAITDFSQGNIDNGWAFLECSIGGVFIGSLLAITNCHFKKNISAREGFIMIAVCWVAGCFLASLPLHFSDLQLSYTDSFFESVSGITTTGATILNDLDTVSHGVLMWRSLMQWIGGISFIILAVIFLPFLHVGGMQIFQTESSNRSENLQHAGKTIAGLLAIYSALTFICILGYRTLGMSSFDAVNHALTTVSTGGFSTHNGSLGHFKSPSIEWLSVIFMIAAALPFVLYIKLISRQNTFLFKDSQVRAAFKIILFLVIILTTWRYIVSDLSFLTSLRQVAFHVVSIMTTTGYTIMDYTSWGLFATIVFLYMTYLGLCSGSAAGGIKIMRLQIVAAQGLTQIRRLIHPSGVFSLSYQGQSISNTALQSVMVFLTLYVLTNAILTIFLSLTGLDFATSLSAAATSIANVGPGIGDTIGPGGNFSTLPGLAKLILCFGMIIGRLELMTIFVLFHPSFWKK